MTSVLAGGSASKPRKVRDFSESFTIRMIRDFFLTLVAVAVVELSLKFGLVLYQYQTEGAKMTEQAAERLAADVTSIMLNSGGPVAAQTVYPILKKNYEEIGYQIAIEPSSMTVTSIEEIFDFTPRGISSDMMEGRFFEVVVPLRADEFCLQCHIDAKLGDELGAVKVRSYLARSIGLWWHEVRITGVFLMANILLHTVVLFLLLRWRMAPLLAIRAMVGELSRSGTSIDHRAEVKSDDEFGQLAHDVNAFLDRLSQIIEDLGDVLTSVAEANSHMGRLQEQLDQGFDRFQKKSRRLLENGSQAKDLEALSLVAQAPSLTILTDLVETIGRSRQETGADLPPELCQHLQNAADDMSACREAMIAVWRGREESHNQMADLGEEVRTMEKTLSDMAVLEEKLKAIAQQGQTLLKRLGHHAEATEDSAAQC